MSNATQLTNQIINFIYERGGFAWRAQSTGLYDASRGGFRTAPKKGVSDILAVFKGLPIAIEVKIGKDKLSDEQDGFLKNFTHAGGMATVAKSFEEFVRWWEDKVIHTSVA